jgi:hypothetical protein
MSGQTPQSTDKTLVCASVRTPVDPKRSVRDGESLPQLGVRVSGTYVYYFIIWDSFAGENTLSKRPATLEAIEGNGAPVMQSRILVDNTELDEHGFLVDRDGNNSYAVKELAARIWSLEVRAAARDIGAMDLTGNEKLILGLESRELRDEARKLRKRCGELLASPDMPRFRPRELATVRLPGRRSMNLTNFSAALFACATRG